MPLNLPLNAAPALEGGGAIPRGGGARGRVHRSPGRGGSGRRAAPPFLHERFGSRFAQLGAGRQAAVIGALVGITGWYFPHLIGGGDNITQSLLAGGVAMSAIPFAFLVRFVLGPLSYAARTPGGLFAPLLVLRAQLGLLFGGLCAHLFPQLGISPEAFAVVGMAAFFTGIVQAPVTGIVLVTEMTAAFTTLLPMLAACFAAMLIAHLLRSTPIYDSLLERLIGEAHPGRAHAPAAHVPAPAAAGGQ